MAWTRPTMADVAGRRGLPALVSIVMRGVPGRQRRHPGAGPADRRRARLRPDQRARKLRAAAVAGARGGVRAAAALPRRPRRAALPAAADARVRHRAVGGRPHPRRADRGRGAAARAVRGGGAARQPVRRRRAGRAGRAGARRWWSPGARPRGVDVVRSDDAVGVGLAVDHLVELGHRSIAHIDGGRAPGQPPTAARVSTRRMAPPRAGRQPTSSPAASPRPRAPAPWPRCSPARPRRAR